MNANAWFVNLNEFSQAPVNIFLLSSLMMMMASFFIRFSFHLTPLILSSDDFTWPCRQHAHQGRGKWKKEEGRKEKIEGRRGSCYPKVSGFKLLIVVGDERLFLSQ